MYKSVDIENFTVFKKAHFDFVPGINVLAGANASGKTHLLKLLYAMPQSKLTEPYVITDYLRSVFNSESAIDLVSQSESVIISTSQFETEDTQFQLTINKRLGAASTRHNQSIPVTDYSTRNPSVFIPAKDVLGNSLGFLSLYEKREIDFDVTYKDILTLASLPPLRDSHINGKQPLLDLLAEKLEGLVTSKGQRFYLSGKNGDFEMHMVAEGWRKLALLYLLIANGSLDSGSTLYWDEPESNLNPSVMDELVQILLELSRLGVQIFLATHNYFILKELDLQRKEDDSLRMFALERKSDGSVDVHPAETYLELEPNLIAEQFDRIYKMQVERALKD